MRRFLLSACFAACLGLTAYTQEKVYETKITATPVLGFNASNGVAVYAGGKNINVVQLTDGKVVLDKSYKDAGVTLSKPTDAWVNNDLSRIAVCDETTVSCIDGKTGSKLWENNSFKELSGGSGSIIICGSYVLVSDKKGRDNFSLTCLGMNGGKELWSLSNEKVKIFPSNMYFIPSCSSLGIFSYFKGGNNQMRLVSLETGKVTETVEMQGEPVFSFTDESAGNIYIHNRASEDVSFITAISMKEGKMLWKTKSANKSPQTPMVMNTNIITYYAKITCFDDKVLLITEGIEAFSTSSGKSLYNVPFVPYYEWGVGHYTNGIFTPVVTQQGILIADRSKGDMYIRMIDKNTGAQIWSTDKLKDMDCAPNAVAGEDFAAVQFGGLNYFEVMNNTGIGKLLKPFTVMGFDLKTGKAAWTIESKKDFYYISASNNNVMIVGKDFQTVDLKTGEILKTEKNPFREDYFMTKYTLGSTHRLQKNVEFDFSARRLMLFEDGKLSVNSF